MIQQQESNFKACLGCYVDSTNTRIDALLKEIQELIKLQYTQKEVDDLKVQCSNLSTTSKSTQKDIHKLAESMILIDGKSNNMDSNARRLNVIIDGIPEEENEKMHDSEKKLLSFLEEKLEFDAKSLSIEKVQRLGKLEEQSSKRSRPY